MYLKRLELSGFKSFARKTTLEFPSRITAIVGPNGSGKSNIKEAMQWALGEQSMKSLRGKKGEDLIWNGSEGFARMGKASVALFFDNKDKRLPIEFDEVIIERRIFRDGLNEYFLNDSPVRLRDIVELTARMGLGETKHNIIGQGEVDRFLLANPRERREMLEEALGLRVYRLKKNEAERKLNATFENMQQVEALLREISPHLKFLRAQARKAEERSVIEEEFRQLQQAYIHREGFEIGEEHRKLTEERNPLVKKQENVKHHIANSTQEITQLENMLVRREDTHQEEEQQILLERQHRELQHQLGRIEGHIEVERERVATPKIRVVDTGYIQDAIKKLVEKIHSVLGGTEEFSTFRQEVADLLWQLETLHREIEHGSIEIERGEEEFSELHRLESSLISLQKELAGVISHIEELRAQRRKIDDQYREIRQTIREADNLLRSYREEERDLLVQLERFRFEEERIRLREAALESEFNVSASEVLRLISVSMESLDTRGQDSSMEMKRKMERTRMRLEEIGGIDETVLKEYRETEGRFSFLSRELEDLRQGEDSLRELIKELEDHMRTDFQKGFSKINGEFEKFFKIIFGGGSAHLEITNYESRITNQESEGETGEEIEENTSKTQEPGVELSVNMPGKRIKGLAMLSGGERALTSIALLFSIVAVNPPPFLILDETDAALDEANTRRYTRILSELSKNTQLLIVTHNRETMKSAGVLYGVTLGPDSVSKLLSLKLEEAEAYTNR